MKRQWFVFTAAWLLSVNLQAQVCDPAVAPVGLLSTYTPGSGALLEWDAVPGSVGVQLKVDLPSGSSINQRILGFEVNHFLVPNEVLDPGTYTWRVQAACSTVPPFAVTPISASNSFAAVDEGPCPATLTDADGHVYNTVVIGSQCWMAENLKVEQYNNGDPIPTGLSNSAWMASTSGAFAVYDNLASNKVTYGLLYNWYAVVDARGLCPAGWHIPTDEEWTQMITVLAPATTCGSCIGFLHSSTAGGKMKTTGTLEAGTGLWITPNNGATNSSGYSGLPGGFRGAAGNFGDRGIYGFWWSSSENSSTLAWNRILIFETGRASRGHYTKQNGLSVRCIQD